MGWRMGGWGMKAVAVWQWHNYCCDQVPTEKLPLRINLDETSICLYQGDGKGTVFIDKKRGPPTQKVLRGKRRCCMTHVALVCDRPDVQAALPQFLIGNEHTLLLRDMPTLLASRPPNTTLLRQKSAWSNDELMATIVRDLGRSLESFRGVYQPIFLFDAVRIHLTRRVLNAIRRAGIWPVLVPARMTWLLQPLDTHVFRLFKIALRREFQAQRLRCELGDLSTPEFLTCVYAAAREVIDRRLWAHAFAEDGFGIGQAEVSAHVRTQLRVEGIPLVIPNDRPSLEQVAECFARRTSMRQIALWRPGDRVAPVLGVAGAPPRRRGPPAAAPAEAAAGAAGPAPAVSSRAASCTRSGRVYSQPEEG